MPNWCINILVVSGKREDVMKFDRQFHGIPQVYPGDPKPTKKRYTFSALRPIPDSILKKGYWDPSPERYRKWKEFIDKLETLRRYDKYDIFYLASLNDEEFPNGHEWQRAKWGTKWDLADDEDVSVDIDTDLAGNLTIIYTFETAWSPVVPLVEFIEKKFKNLKFRLEFIEDGVGFAGYFTNGDYADYVFEDFKQKPELLADFRYICIHDYM